MTFYLGLTGGIATGKSTAASYFRERGLRVIDADQIAHAQQAPGQVTWREIKENFGAEFINEDQTVNRQKLGAYVFAHPDELARLSKISHGAVLAEIKQEMQAAKRAGEGVCVIDVPLLFEAGWQDLFDATLLIAAPYDLELERLMKRNQLSREQAQVRIKSQLPLDEKRRLASYVIENTGTIEELRTNLQQLLEEIS